MSAFGDFRSDPDKKILRKKVAAIHAVSCKPHSRPHLPQPRHDTICDKCYLLLISSTCSAKMPSTVVERGSDGPVVKRQKLNGASNAPSRPQQESRIFTPFRV